MYALKLCNSAQNGLIGITEESKSDATWTQVHLDKWVKIKIGKAFEWLFVN